jgi:hypothetical protein
MDPMIDILIKRWQTAINPLNYCADFGQTYRRCCLHSYQYLSPMLVGQTVAQCSHYTRDRDAPPPHSYSINCCMHRTVLPADVRLRQLVDIDIIRREITQLPLSVQIQILTCV